MIVVKRKEVMINPAKVVTVDIVASNGVIHVIDSVIRPPVFLLPGRNSSRTHRRALHG